MAKLKCQKPLLQSAIPHDEWSYLKQKILVNPSFWMHFMHLTKHLF